MKFKVTKYGIGTPGQGQLPGRERPVVAEFTTEGVLSGDDIGAPEPGDGWLTIRVVGEVDGTDYLAAAMHFRPGAEGWELAGEVHPVTPVVDIPQPSPLYSSSSRTEPLSRRGPQDE